MEIWKEIEDYDNYEVSNYGRVKNAKTGRILKQSIDTEGYKRVNLYKNNKSKAFKIHRLVAFAFCDNKNNKDIIDHKDRDRTNNHFSNLRFCTSSENQHNKSIQSNNTSGFAGVSFHKRDKKWQALIRLNNKQMYIGSYETFEEAKQARLKKEKELFKEFAPN